MDEIDFDWIRECYRSEDSNRIEQSLIPLIKFIRNEKSEKIQFRYHPLGFIYARLHEYSNRDILRIHIWSEHSMSQKPLMDIHNHYYNVNSFVLSGSISNTRYRLIESDEYTHSIFKGTYKENDRRVLTRTDKRKTLQLVDTEIIDEGTFYRISKDEIHSGAAQSGFAVTVVFNDEAGNPNPLVFGPISGNQEYEYTSELVNRDYVQELKKLIPVPNKH